MDQKPPQGPQHNELTTEEKRTAQLSGKNTQRICFVANNQSDLDLISKIWFGDHLRDPQIYNEMGRISRFPKTAINTFDKFTKLSEPEKSKKREELTLSEKEQKELFPPEVYPFSKFFYISREHWESELKTIQKWAQEIKLVAPTLYRLLIVQYGN